MKQCPFCKRTYDDPSAEFCDEDNVRLRDVDKQGSSASMGNAPQQRYSESSVVASPPPPVTAKCKNCSWSGSFPTDGYCPDCGARLDSTVQGTQLTPPQPSSMPSPFVSAVAQPSLELVFPDSTKITVNQFPYIFGRKDVLRYPESSYVSGKHLAFYYENGQFTVEDTNSLNGTSLNGQIIGKDKKGTGKMLLNDGDTLQLALDEKGEGAFKFTVKLVRGNLLK